MSAQQRTWRSASKTAPDPDVDVAERPVKLTGYSPTADVITSSKTDPGDSPSSRPLSTSALAADTTDREFDAAAMLSTLAAPGLGSSEPQVGGSNRAAFDHHPDDRSSSLSELGDASDDQSEATPRQGAGFEIGDNDSEAETERLEETPRRMTRTATDASLASEYMYNRTPSKLAHSKTTEQIDSTDFDTASDAQLGEPLNGNDALHALSLAASSEAATLVDGVGKKRKRPSMEVDTPDEQGEGPARKRSGGSLDDSRGTVINSTEPVDVEEELEHAEERITQLAQEEMELEERQADIASEAVNELATVAKHTKPRKGGRRGKRKVEDTASITDALASIEGHDGEVDGDDEEDDNGVVDEEAAKKKHAIEELAKIQKKFKVFREKLCDEQIAQAEQELEMLKQPNCEHPEYLAMIKCIDDRRAEKLAYERQLLHYKQNNLEAITTAERHQLHSQYFQTVRDKREDILAECNQKIFDLQRGRRQLGADEVEYMMRLPEKRSDQIRHQAAYNLEVSILSGVAKYVGFPAAPEIRPARPSEIDEDLRAMKIITRPPPAPTYVRPTYGRTSTADEAAAEEQFIERTPWANPQHPVHQQSHQQSHYGVPSSAPRMSNYHTPIGQRRMEPLHGSASTIEANSNPPSTGGANAGRFAESESPVLQMKRPPIEHHQIYSEAPGSYPRNMGNLGREPYGMSSPAGPSHMEAPPEDPPRWGGIRQNMMPGASLPGRPEAARVPLTQRSAMGTVSVGSGSGLFSR